MQYKGVKKPLREIARELDVDAVVTGSVLRSGEKLRITVQLLRHIPEHHLEREAQAVAANFAEWEVVLGNPSSGEVTLAAHAEDASGNIERTPHLVRVGPP